MLAGAAGVLACCLLWWGNSSGSARSPQQNIVRLQTAGKPWDTLMLDLQMDIILWQTTGAHRSCSEQGLQLLMEKEWRKLSRTLLSDLAWVRARGFTLQEDVEPSVFHDASSVQRFICTISL